MSPRRAMNFDLTPLQSQVCGDQMIDKTTQTGSCPSEGTSGYCQAFLSNTTRCMTPGADILSRTLTACNARRSALGRIRSGLAMHSK